MLDVLQNDMLMRDLLALHQILMLLQFDPEDIHIKLNRVESRLLVSVELKSRLYPYEPPYTTLLVNPKDRREEDVMQQWLQLSNWWNNCTDEEEDDVLRVLETSTIFKGRHVLLFSLSMRRMLGHLAPAARG